MILFNLLFIIGGLLVVGWINYVLLVGEFSFGLGVNYYLIVI